jgi:glucokinase
MLLGVDIGGTKVIAAAADPSGEIVAKEQRATEFHGGGEHALGNVFACCDAVLERAGRSEVAAIGISCGGPLDRTRGVILNPPNLGGWINMPLTQRFRERYGAGAYLDNDANLAALGEARRGAGKDVATFVYFTISTGVGGGVILDGKLWHGANDNGGEVGHQVIVPDGPLCGCGNRGCLEALVSGTSIGRRAREELRSGNATSTSTLVLRLVDGDIDKVTAKTVAEAAAEGDRVALRIWEETGYYLGLGIANVVSIINPERIVLGGGVIKAGDLLLEPTRRTFAQRALPDLAKIVDIVPAALGDDAGIVGALELALEAVS